MGKTVEKRTAETILQIPEKVKVGRRTFIVERPTIGTIILMSKYIAELPEFKNESTSFLEDVLRNAKNATGVGNALASVIVGSRGLNSRNPLRRWLKHRRFERVSRYILDNTTPSETTQLAVRLFKMLEVYDFFGLIAFLNGINVTKATTTASGQQ